MDLNMENMFYVEAIGRHSDSTGKHTFGDTSLQLDCLGHYQGSVSNISTMCKSNTWSRPFRHSEVLPHSSVSDDGCALVLGLGPAVSSSDAFSINKCNTSIFGQVSSGRLNLFSEDESCHHVAKNNHSEDLRLGLSGGLVLRNGLPQTPTGSFAVSRLCSGLEGSFSPSQSNVIDEGSTSAVRRKSHVFTQSLSFSSCREQPSLTFDHEDLNVGGSVHLPCSSEPSALTEGSTGVVTLATNGSAMTEHKNHPRKCRFKGCAKGARGASGLCIAHGGGQRCQKPGCNKGAESRTVYCKAHGGGKRCHTLGCTKSAEGKTDFCIAHGGGRRCGQPECTKAARGKSGLCIRHGGGKRCTVEGCSRSAEGYAGLCISHGGGRRCQYTGCSKGAQGSTMFCKAHGGGKRCIFTGCIKGAEGSTPLCKGHGGGKRCMYEGGGICPKSVHGGTHFCVAHGGGKRCAVPGCTKSARGRTDCCVKHGGGKRCHHEGCEKSAQGSTDFCKAHGGGKRCMWGQEGTTYAGMLVKGKNGDVQSGPCDKFARGRSGLCAAHGTLLQVPNSGKNTSSSGIIPGLFCGLAAPAAGSIVHNDSSAVTANSEPTASASGQSSESVGRRHHIPFIPPQVLVPFSMKSSGFSLTEGENRDAGPVRSSIVSDLALPEGRVHGGGLMHLFGGDLQNAANCLL